MQDIRANLERVRERVARAAERAGRRAEDVLLVGVSKTVDVARIRAAIAAGLGALGENRVQEARDKITELGRTVQWHLVGHLQTNKVRPALRAFAILHAVDSERLLRAINAAATSPVRLMIEVNVSGEATKHGLAPAELPALLAIGRELPGLQIAGLMTVAPQAANPEQVRPVFRELAALAHEHALPSLSMGMSEDFEVAIEEGATHVRIGRAIFGERAQ